MLIVCVQYTLFLIFCWRIFDDLSNFKQFQSKERNREAKLGTKGDSKYRITFIFSETLVYLLLLFQIGRKIYKFHRRTQIYADHPSRSDAPFVDSVDVEINQSKSTNRREADQETSNKRLYMCL